MMKISLDDVYLWGDDQKHNHLHVCPIEKIDKYALVRGETDPEDTLHFRHSMGGRPYDLVSTEWPGMDLISDRIVEVLKSNELTGWQIYRVIITNKRGDDVPGYHGLQVTGRCGPIDNSRSPRIMEAAPFPGCKPGLVWKGYYFDEDSWDGSDFFIPQTYKGRTNCIHMVTRRVKDIFEEEKITNVEFEPVKDISRLVL